VQVKKAGSNKTFGLLSKEQRRKEEALGASRHRIHPKWVGGQA
jgi:hypothetical protein